MVKSAEIHCFMKTP